MTNSIINGGSGDDLILPPRHSDGSFNVEGNLDIIRGGKGDDIINPLRVDLDDNNRPINISLEPVFNADGTLDLSATFGTPRREAQRSNNPLWDGGDGDDIIIGPSLNNRGATYLGGNGDDQLFSGRTPLGPNLSS